MAAGRIHSFQSMGAVDGPGLRYVVFMQGCPLRCAYCHNPDTWDLAGGIVYTPEQVVTKILRYRSYIEKSGGVTVSGGEPLLQWQFVAELFSQLKRAGIHTALDTSAMGEAIGWDAVLAVTDLVLCDIKFATEESYRTYSGGSLEHVKQFLERVAARKVPLWVRHVVVPGLTDKTEEVKQVYQLARAYQVLEKFELLPFRKLCQSKYDEMQIPFPLAEAPEATEEKIQKLMAMLEKEEDSKE